MITTLLRKPLDGSVAENTLKHGCGAINIDATRIGNIVQDTSKNGRSADKHKSTVFQSGFKEEFEGKITTGRWPANFILTHKDDCELKGTRKIKEGKVNKDIGGSLREVGLYQDGLKNRAKDQFQGEEMVDNWVCIESCPVIELDRQTGHQKSGVAGSNSRAWGVMGKEDQIFRKGWQSNGSQGYADEGGASRFFKQFKKENNMNSDMIEYFKTMITPPVDDACVLVSTPDDLDFSSYKKEVYEEGALIPSYEPIVHGLILLGEPTAEQSKKIMDILKPGAHVVMIPKDIGYKGVIALEDTGFEVRDAIFVAEKSDSFYYTPKASRSEREAGLEGFNKKSNTDVTGRKEGSAGLVMRHEDREGSPEKGNPYAGVSGQQPRANNHPTVKPISIMEWCARDISPNSKVVDPFLGSGTTGIAMSRLHHDFVGIELNPEYARICEARIRHWMPIGTEIESEAQVGKAEPKKGEQISIFDLFD